MKYRHLDTGNVKLAKQLMDVFAIAFEDPESYQSKKPNKNYTEELLKNNNNIVLVALADDNTVVGGLVAYELQKFEQEHSEIYLYDLAVLEEYRNQGIATKLIELLKEIGVTRSASVIFVQADNEDSPAVALYTKLAKSIETSVTHFDISV
jgi:aminoglycoside 3-N-acetyltransferase I